MAAPGGEMEQLLALLRTDDPPVAPDIIEHVVRELRTHDAPTVIVALAHGLRDRDPEYRCTIALVFLTYDFTAAIQHVEALLHKTDDDELRGFLCQELGRWRHRAAVPLLVNALLNDPDGTNRTWAAWGLGNIGDPAALPSLQSAMHNDAGVDNEGRPVREIAAEAIRRMQQGNTTMSVA